MSEWVQLVTAAPGGAGELNAANVDWSTGTEGLFSGAVDTFLVDPREMRRAETAPSVLTMFSSDGTLCVGESLEEEVPPDEEYRYSEEYHTLYYSNYPRDPRMRVPLVRRPRAAGAPATPAARAGSPVSEAQRAEAAGKAAEKKSGTSSQSEEALGVEPRPLLGGNTIGDFVPNVAHQQQQQPVQQAFPPQQQQHRRGGTRGGAVRTGGRKGPVNNVLIAENGTIRISGEEPSALREFLENAREDTTLEDIKGQIVGLSKDQDGSRYVQRLLDDERNVEPVCNGILPNMHELMVDVFGNYVLQKVLDVLPVGSELSRKITTQVKGRLREYSFHMYGCRVMQKIVERSTPDVRDEILAELRGCIVECIFDQNANHVAQKIIEVMPEKAHFVTEDFIPRLNELSCHPYGCRVLQCVFEKCSDVTEVNIRPVFETVIERIHEYVMDRYGNYVVQHALLNAPEDLRHRLIALLIPHVYALSCSKFASNVAEKTVQGANEDEMQRIVDTLTRPLGSIEDGSYLVLMMQDPYANYVVQRLLHQVSPAQQQLIALRTRPHIPNIRRSVYGQHLLQKMEAMRMFNAQETSGTPPLLPQQIMRGGRKGRAGRDGCNSQQSSPTDAVLTVPAGAAGPIYTYPQPLPSLGEILLAPSQPPRQPPQPPPPPPPQQSPPQPHGPAVALGGQSCYAGVVMQPQPQPQPQPMQQPMQQPIALQGQVPYDVYGAQPHHQQGDGYAMKPVYGNEVSGGWGAPYAQIPHPMQQTMVYKQNAYSNNSPLAAATLNTYNQQPEQYPMAIQQPQGQFFTHPISVPTHGRH